MISVLHANSLFLLLPKGRTQVIVRARWMGHLGNSFAAIVPPRPTPAAMIETFPAPALQWATAPGCRAAATPWLLLLPTD
jgi:hypothetical protein